jgi:hypothetical protein
MVHLQRVKCRLSRGYWGQVEDFPAWPLGIKQVVRLRRMEMFELANFLDVFIILAANVLRTLVGRARYHEGLAIDHFVKGDHFPQGARGDAIGPNDMLLPFEDLPSCYHVLGAGPEEFNSVNAAVFADRKMSECFAIARGIRKLTTADGLVADVALGEFAIPICLSRIRSLGTRGLTSTSSV